MIKRPFGHQQQNSLVKKIPQTKQANFADFEVKNFKQEMRRLLNSIQFENRLNEASS